MSARLLLVLALLLVATAAQAQEVEPAWLEVADVALRLRSGPSTDDEVITQLTPRRRRGAGSIGRRFSCAIHTPIQPRFILC